MWKPLWGLCDTQCGLTAEKVRGVQTGTGSEDGHTNLSCLLNPSFWIVWLPDAELFLFVKI